MTSEVALRKVIPLATVPGHWPVIVLLAPMFGTLDR